MSPPPSPPGPSTSRPQGLPHDRRARADQRPDRHRRGGGGRDAGRARWPHRRTRSGPQYSGWRCVDLGGDWLLPGLVELHTDNLERAFSPRLGVRWPADAAMLTHDAQVAAAGITTVGDAVCVGYYGGKSERLDYLSLSIEVLHRAQAARALKADHFLHLRLEIADPHMLELFEPLMARALLAADLVHGPHARAAAIPRRRPVPRHPCWPQRCGDRGADRAPDGPAARARAEPARRGAGADRGSSRRPRQPRRHHARARRGGSCLRLPDRRVPDHGRGSASRPRRAA